MSEGTRYTYKIGEVSNLYGISNDTIRYYESRGIITPKRDEESGYRYFDSWDINFLLDCLRYRSMDLPLSDIEQMIKEDDVEEVEERLRKKETELIRQIYDLKSMVREISALRGSISDIKTRLGKFTIEKSPEMIWQCQRTKIRSEDGELIHGKAAEAVNEWMKHMIFLGHTFLMAPGDDKQKFDEYNWGFSLSPDKLYELGLEIPQTAKFISSRRSIHTFFAAEEEGTFMPLINEQVLDPIKAQGFRITDPPVGNLLVRVHENGKMKRYFEVWVPID